GPPRLAARRPGAARSRPRQRPARRTRLPGAGRPQAAARPLLGAPADPHPRVGARGVHRAEGHGERPRSRARAALSGGTTMPAARTLQLLGLTTLLLVASFLDERLAWGALLPRSGVP